MATALDRYKLVALQSKMAGMPSDAIASAMGERIAVDVTHEAASMGRDPQELLLYLSHQLQREGIGAAPNVADLGHAIASIADRAMLRRVVGMPRAVVG